MKAERAKTRKKRNKKKRRRKKKKNRKEKVTMKIITKNEYYILTFTYIRFELEKFVINQSLARILQNSSWFLPYKAPLMSYLLISNDLS